MFDFRIEWTSDFSRAHTLLVSYLKADSARWKDIELKVKKQLEEGTSVYVWGCGFHTSQLFAFTDLKKYLSIKGLIDSSSTKWGKQFGDLKCYSPESVDLKQEDIIIISSYASEDEIYESLEKYRRKGATVVRLHGVV